MQSGYPLFFKYKNCIYSFFRTSMKSISQKIYKEKSNDLIDSLPFCLFKLLILIITASLFKAVEKLMRTDKNNFSSYSFKKLKKILVKSILLIYSVALKMLLLLLNNIEHIIIKLAQIITIFIWFICFLISLKKTFCEFY